MAQHNPAEDALRRLDLQTQQGQRAAQPQDLLPLIQQAQRPGDIQAAGGLITGIPARARIKEQQILNEQQRVKEIQRQDIIGDDIFKAAGLAPIDFQSVEQVSSINRLLDDPSTRAAGIDFIEAQSARRQAAYAAGIEQNRVQFQEDKDISKVESEFRGEYQALVGPAIEGLNAIAQMQTQISLDSPSGSFNAARLFVRQLDASMFSSDELTAQMQQQGLMGQYSNWVNWASDKGIFDQASLAQMHDSMAALGEFFETFRQGVTEQATELTNNSFGGRLNVDNVITMDGYLPIDLQPRAGAGAARKVDPSLLPEGVEAL